MFLSKLIEWKFNKHRQKTVNTLIEKRGNCEIQKKLDDEFYLVEFGISTDTTFIELFHPLFGEDIPLFIRKLFNDCILSIHIQNTGIGVQTSSIYESLKYLELKGYCSTIVEPYLIDIRNKAIESLNG